MATAALSTVATGEGPVVVMLPSLGRGASDFEDLSRRLAGDGYRAIAVDPRGIGASAGSLDGVTLHDLAADVAAVIARESEAPVALAGHAFGNRLARCVAADRPDLVRGVVLLAAGGLIHPSDEVMAAMRVILDESSPDDKHLEALTTAFFAPGNDASVWRGGWWRQAALGQAAATRATAVEDWWAAGSAPVLVVQGLQDVFAVPENGRRLAADHPDRVQLVELENAGHALLPEQPEAIARAVLAFLARL